MAACGEGARRGRRERAAKEGGERGRRKRVAGRVGESERETGRAQRGRQEMASKRVSQSEKGHRWRVSTRPYAHDTNARRTSEHVRKTLRRLASRSFSRPSRLTLPFPPFSPLLAFLRAPALLSPGAHLHLGRFSPGDLVLLGGGQVGHQRTLPAESTRPDQVRSERLRFFHVRSGHVRYIRSDQVTRD